MQSRGRNPKRNKQKKILYTIHRYDSTIVTSQSLTHFPLQVNRRNLVTTQKEAGHHMPFWIKLSFTSIVQLNLNNRSLKSKLILRNNIYCLTNLSSFNLFALKDHPNNENKSIKLDTKHTYIHKSKRIGK